MMSNTNNTIINNSKLIEEELVKFSKSIRSIELYYLDILDGIREKRKNMEKELLSSPSVGKGFLWSTQMSNMPLEEKKFANSLLLFKNKSEAEIIDTGLDVLDNLSGVIEAFLEETSGKTTYELGIMLTGAKQLQSFLEGVEGSEIPGYLSDEDVDKLRISPHFIENLKEAIQNLKKEFADSDFLAKFTDDISNAMISFDNEDVNGFKEHIETALKPLDNVGNKINKLGEDWKKIFGNDNRIGQELSNIGSSLSSTVKGVSEAATGVAKLATGDIVGGTLETISGIATVVSSISNSSTKRKEAEIKRLQADVVELKNYYSDLGIQIDKAYGASKGKLYEDQTENLEKQRDAINQQIELENEKKNSNQDSLKKYQEELRTINKSIEDSKRNAIEALAGTSIKSAIDSFASAYVEAWAAGEDKAKSMSKVVQNILKTAVTAMLKDNIKGEVEEYMKILSEAMKDGELSTEEKTNLDKAKNDIINKSNISDDFKEYIFGDDSVARTATTKGISSMSQESADELNGSFTTLRVHTSEINESVKILSNNSSTILSHLANIEGNTSKLASIEENLIAMKSGIDYINIKGIALK